MTALTEHLARHAYVGGYLTCTCGWRYPEERTHGCGEESRIVSAHAAHVEAELLAAGIVAVQLPERQPWWASEPAENNALANHLADILDHQLLNALGVSGFEGDQLLNLGWCMAGDLTRNRPSSLAQRTSSPKGTT